MRTPCAWMALLLSLPLSLPCLGADLAGVRAEPNPERRSERALANADTALDEARKSLEQGEQEKLISAIGEIRDSLLLSKESLEQSGKNPRKNPKYFKRAEIGIRKLIRRLENFRFDVTVDDRKPVDDLIEKAHAVQEEILQGIMTKKRK